MTTNTNSTLDFTAVDTFSINANRGTRPFRSLVQDENGHWNFEVIGTLEKVQAETMKGQELVFQSTRNDKRYELGTFRDVQVLDHEPLFRPFLADGWQVKKHQTLRGGAKIATELVHPDFTIDDHITWDFTSRGGHHQELDNAKMMPSVLILADARKGIQYSITAGLHRLVCTNGLIAKVLDLGSLEFSHSLEAEAAAAKVGKFSTDLLNNTKWNELAYHQFSPDAATKMATWLQHRDTTPRLLAPSLAALDTWNATRQDALITELGAITEGFTVVDILNAITNVDQGIRTFWNIDRLAESLRNVAELAEWTR